MDFRTDEEKQIDHLAGRVCDLERALGITLRILLTAVPLDESDKDALRKMRALIEA